MAGRTADISTSSFKPLSLDEIMMVPLAKQKAEDNAQLALDEFAALESQALDADKEYVSGQLGAFRQEAGLLSDQLMSEGVDRNLINKVRGLRNRKSKELSLEGKTGQAAAAYNQFEANKKSIMARKDLTAEQKERGLARAKSDYAGVSEGGTYQDYVGTAHIDLMQKGRDIVKNMTPEQKADALGMTVDEHGIYRDKTYSYEKLSSEQIQRVVYQALKNDLNVNAYATELQDLGIANADELLQNAAISAGNVGQVSKTSEKYTIAPQYLQQALGGIVDAGKARLNLTQPWSNITVQAGATAYNRTLAIDDSFAEEVGFSPEIFDNSGELLSGGNIKDDEFTGRKMIPGFWGANTYHEPAETSEYKDWKKKRERTLILQEKLNKLRVDSPEAYAGKNDQYVYNTYLRGKRDAATSHATITRPNNVNNTFYNYTTTKILGTDGKAGDMFGSARGMKVMGELGSDYVGNAATMVKKLGYSNVVEMSDAFMDKGQVLGMVASDPDLPYGIAIQVPHSNGESFEVIVVSGDKNITDQFPQAKKMMQNLSEGTSYQVKVGSHVDPDGKSSRHYEHYINRVSPITGRYESMLLRSGRKFSKDEIDELQFGPNNTAYLNGETIDDVDMRSYEDVINTAANKIQDYYDRTQTGKTSEKTMHKSNQQY